VAELRTWAPIVTSVLASAEACDRVSDLPGACRVSPGEVALVGDVSEAAVAAAVARRDPDAVVLDVSGGWDALSLDGPGSREAFARLSALVLPIEGSLVGEVAGVGVRILVDRDRIDLLVPSMVAAHVRERFETDCADLLR
jgi:sarcosine oxidase gamma subunit